VERKQTYTYRLVLWGLYGDSPGTEVSGCRAGAGKSKVTTNKAHATAAGATAAGATAEAEGGWAYPLFMSTLMVVLPLMVRNQQLWGTVGAWLGATLPASANAAPVTAEELAVAAEEEEERDNRWLAGAFLRLSRILWEGDEERWRNGEGDFDHNIAESASNSSHPFQGRDDMSQHASLRRHLPPPLH
jgi:hypothetical protein